MKTFLVPAAALLLVSAAGCSDAGPTGATEEATTEVRVAGDDPDGGSASRTESPASSASSADLEGSVQVAARVYLQSTSGTWVELTGNGAAEQTVDASGEEGFRLLARTEVDATTYQRVRVVFEDVRAEVEGGLAVQIGAGSVSLGLDTGSDVTVEREIELHAEAGSVSRIDIDLNASEWLGAAVAGEAGAASAFASAVTVGAR